MKKVKTKKGSQTAVLWNNLSMNPSMWNRRSPSTKKRRTRKQRYQFQKEKMTLLGHIPFKRRIYGSLRTNGVEPSKKAFVMLNKRL